MSRKVYYDAGPDSVKFGIAGVFYKGVPKEVPDPIALVLLRKGWVKEWVDIDNNIPYVRIRKNKEV
jgi:hypothetical protein